MDHIHMNTIQYFQGVTQGNMRLHSEMENLGF